MKQEFVKAGFLLMAAFLFSFAAKAQSPDAITGVWWNAEKTSKIQVYEKDGKYHGKIIHLEDKNDAEGKPRKDVENPNDKLKSRALMGLVILKDLEYEGQGEYDEGEIYDPKSGKTYSSSAKLVGKDKLDLRGYIGFSLIGRTSAWTRAEE